MQPLKFRVCDSFTPFDFFATSVNRMRVVTACESHASCDYMQVECYSRRHAIRMQLRISCGSHESVRVDSLITGFLKNERAIRRATRKFVPIARFASL